MKNIKFNLKTKIILLTSIILILIVGVSTTIAVLKDKQDITNTFIDPAVEIYIEETFENDVKSDVYIENYSDIPLYVRALIVVNYKNATGQVHSTIPVSNIENSEDYDYTIALNDTSWVKGSDGYYYYIHPLDVDEVTDVLIEEAYTNNTKTPQGYGLNIEILASAIQANPSTVVLEQWDSGVSSVNADGTLAIK